MSDKKKMKKLLKILQAIDLPPSTIECMIYDPRETRKKLIKTFALNKNPKREPYNSKTKYGLLYTTFNNLKVKLNLSDYFMRKDFINWFIDDKEFDAIFDKWEKYDFQKQDKPNLTILDLNKPLTKDNVKLSVYELSIIEAHKMHSQPIVELDISGAIVCVHSSISKASRASGVPLKTIRAELKNTTIQNTRFMIQCHTNNER